MFDECLNGSVWVGGFRQLLTHLHSFRERERGMDMVFHDCLSFLASLRVSADAGKTR